MNTLKCSLKYCHIVITHTSGPTNGKKTATMVRRLTNSVNREVNNVRVKTKTGIGRYSSHCI